MATDSHLLSTGRSGAPARALGIALAVGAVLATSGCLFGEPGSSAITVTNESSVEVSVFVDESAVPRTSVRAGGVRHMVSAGDEGNCMEWLLSARTAEGTVVSTFGPPVCDKDEWVITQDDVDAAVTSE